MKIYGLYASSLLFPLNQCSCVENRLINDLSDIRKPRQKIYGYIGGSIVPLATELKSKLLTLAILSASQTVIDTRLTRK
jgi:hypothetical protein